MSAKVFLNNVSRGTLPSKTHAGRAGIAARRQGGRGGCLPNVRACAGGRAGSLGRTLRRLEASPALPAAPHGRKLIGIVMI